MDALLEQAVQGMKKNGFEVIEVRTAAEARDYLLAHIDAGQSVGVGGSVSVRDTGVLAALEEKGCKVYTSWGAKPEDVPMIRENSRKADVYLSSANALSETGEIVNIDGTGNRVSATLFGPKRCIFVCGINKLCPDLQSAVDRARNIAAPRNAQRLGVRTPCAVDGKCHDCKSPDRICRAMVIHMGPPLGMEKCEIVLIGESLGY